MAGTLNKVTLIGNVCRDPEIRSTQDGKEIANFTLATSDTWKDKVTGEKREKPEWHKIVVFVPQLVEIIKKYVKKGSKLFIEGSLQTRRWMDQSNVEKYITEILLQSYNSVLIMLDNANKSSSDDKHTDSKADRIYEVEEIDDNIPF